MMVRLKEFMVSIDAGGETQHHQVVVTEFEMQDQLYRYSDSYYASVDLHVDDLWKDAAVDKVIEREYGGHVDNADDVMISTMWEGEE